MAGPNTVVLTDANFDQEVTQASGVVLVDFYTQWCGPCKMLAPVIDKLATAWVGKAKICKLDAGEHGQSAMKYNIQVVPTLIVFKDGQPVQTLSGPNEKMIVAALEAATK